jgi:glycoside/pentoside/hexuronide:cation symporter, GPH family
LQLMGLFGYVAQSSTQTPGALHGIWIILSLVPIVGYLIMLLIMTCFYKLSEEQVAEMMASNRLREASSEEKNN